MARSSGRAARRQADNRRGISPAELTESHRLLSMAEGLAHFGHWWIVPGGNAILRSDQASRIIGIPRGQRLGVLAFLRRVAPADRRFLLRAVASAARGSREVACRARLVRGGKVVRHVIVKARADRRNGAGNALFGVVRDITELVAAEEQLIGMRDDAQAATRAKSEFLATMSHEIRTPMTGVMGMIDLMRSSPTSEESERYLSAMRQSAELLMGVLDGILDFSKAESGKIELDDSSFDFEALVQGTIDMFQNAASKKGLLFELERDVAGSSIVRGDPLRLQQVLSNLISNAIKFTDDGRISVRLQARAGTGDKLRWRVEVRDTGIGIAAAEQVKLFEPFVQAGDRRFGGTGLGLAISRRLIEAMGGRTGMESVAGLGSTFWFEVDLPAGGALQPSDQAPVTGGAAEPLHILIAEDNAINQMLIAALVRRLGHRATCVDNGRRAVEAAQAVGFDCLLLDMQMPEMDGLAATRAIRSSAGPNRAAPIIALTADAAPDRRRFYDNAGLSGFLTKPIDVEALRRVLAPIAARHGGSLARSGSDQPAIDHERLAELRITLGTGRFLELLRLLAAELIEQPARLQRACAQEDDIAVRSLAHNLKGAAANLGAVHVARAAKAVEIALPGAELELALRRLHNEAQRAGELVGELLSAEAPPARSRA